MSLTTCPADAAYPPVKQAFPIGVAAVLATRAPPPPAPGGEPGEQTAAPSPSASAETATTAPAATETGDRQDGAAAGDGGVEVPTVALIAAGVAAAGATVGLAHYKRRLPSAVQQPRELGVGVSGNPPDIGRDAEGTTDGTSA